MRGRRRPWGQKRGGRVVPLRGQQPSTLLDRQQLQGRAQREEMRAWVGERRRRQGLRRRNLSSSEVLGARKGAGQAACL
jgi:hypothetical protein